MSKKSHFTGPLASNIVRRAQTLLKSEPHDIYHIRCSLWRQTSWSKSLFVICKFLRIFVNILSADDKYSLLNRNNLRHAIQMQICQKQNPFSELVSAFFKSILNFERFQKKDDPHRWRISKITDSEKRR